MGSASSSESRKAHRSPGVDLSKELLKQYCLGSLLGEGSFGQVYSCRHLATGEQAVVKIVDKAKTPLEASTREAQMMWAVQHKNVVALRCVFADGDFACLVMDRYSGGTLVHGLHRHHREHGKTDSFRLVHIAAQASAALQFIHSRGIIHSDVKCDNFLMDRPGLGDKSCVIALGDFGMAEPLDPDERLLAGPFGTIAYCSPERLDRTTGYGHKADTWALGVVVYTLLAGRLPFGKDGLKAANTYPPRYSRRLPAECKAFVSGLLELDEGTRMSAEEAVDHPWVGKGADGELACAASAATPASSEGWQEEVAQEARAWLELEAPTAIAQVPEDDEYLVWMKVLFGPLYSRDQDWED